MSLIYLIGYRATGKTTIGSLLAERLGCAFYDLDSCLCQRQGKSVAAIVAERGWEAFRHLETETLQTVTAEAHGRAVLATGGGAVINPWNRQFMRDHGLVFWLHAPEQLLAQRLGANPLPEQRPSLTNQGLLEEITAVLQERTPLYASCAHYQISSASPRDVVCASIIAKISAVDGYGKI